jgi:DNA-binding NarL/FixJ family response regulator
LQAAPALERAATVAAKLSVRRGKDQHPAGLTPREVDVLRLVSQGMADAEVAEALFISARTVNTHLTSIYNKLGVNSRAAATRFAVEQGLTGSSSR